MQVVRKYPEGIDRAVGCTSIEALISDPADLAHLQDVRAAIAHKKRVEQEKMALSDTEFYLRYGELKAHYKHPAAPQKQTQKQDRLRQKQKQKQQQQVEVESKQGHGLHSKTPLDSAGQGAVAAGGEDRKRGSVIDVESLLGLKQGQTVGGVLAKTNQRALTTKL